jgi:hypothetical protein
MTSFHALFSIGMMMGAASSSLFAAIGAGLTSHFFIVASGALLIVIWLSGNLVHDAPESTNPVEGPLFRLPNRSLVSIGIITFCCMLGEGAMSDWSVNYMENVNGQ